MPPALLLEPTTLGAWALPNRVVMAPMTRSRAQMPGNNPTPLHAEYYRQRAGAGLIVTEATQVTPRGIGYPATPGIYTAEQVAGWQLVTDAVHSADGRILLQLWHVGRISHPSYQPNGELPVAPSAIAPKGETRTSDGTKAPFVTPRALTLAEIPAVVEEFRRGAQLAKDAGFDGVEIHGANGYLLDQFLRSGSNTRTDDYGGSAANRARFGVEVATAVAEVWGGARVGYRIAPVSPFNDMVDADPDETFGTLIELLNPLGLAYIHAVEHVEGVDNYAIDLPALRALNQGGWIACGGFTPESAANALESNEGIDAIAFGRPYIANPDLPERIALGAPLAEVHWPTVYGGTEVGYTDYPALASALTT